MPRSARPWEPSSYYHVESRAHSGAPIFDAEEERAFVVRRAARVFAEEGVECLAWSVLVNHYHMVVRVPGPPGPSILRLNTAIARRVRLRYGGQGAVFQGRFFSGLCTDEAALLNRLVYVTANPLHHGVVASLDALRTHPWSSLGEALGTRPPTLLCPDTLHGILDPHGDRTRSRERFVELLQSRVQSWNDSNGGTGRDAGTPPARDLVVARRLSDELDLPRTLGEICGPVWATGVRWEAGEARRAMLRAEGWTPARLVPVACAIAAADVDAVRAGGRTARESAARSIVAHVARDAIGWSLSEVAAAVGTGTAPVHRARSRGRTLLAAAGLSADEVLLRSRAAAGQGCLSALPGAGRRRRIPAGARSAVSRGPSEKSR